MRIRPGIRFDADGAERSCWIAQGAGRLAIADTPQEAARRATG
jgi:hypothetical protein